MNRYAPVGTTLFALFASPIAMAQQPSANQPPTPISTLPTVTAQRAACATSAFRLNAMAQDGRPGTCDEMSLRDFGFAPSYKMGIGTPTEITSSILVQHNIGMPDYGVSLRNQTQYNSVHTNTNARETASNTLGTDDGGGFHALSAANAWKHPSLRRSWLNQAQRAGRN
ncbi:hypothetical protein [Paralcaligenes ureilyticus]|uniref:Uncharacterized protein n=1 Tax=Paralcaligenes ureilyticus TaxID=627131 RepID=A0A4R3MAP3_9BURK|nr:hypothetical protein EDC26_102158 [Paralcaligenes ureilyticus]